MKKLRKRHSGEGYIDVCVLVVCAMLVLALVVRVLPVYVAKQQLRGDDKSCFPHSLGYCMC